MLNNNNNNEPPGELFSLNVTSGKILTFSSFPSGSRALPLSQGINFTKVRREILLGCPLLDFRLENNNIFIY